MTTPHQPHCGYIAFVGLPNAGKSTLLNACLGTKIAGVSKRPQTTRNKILGVETRGAAQLIFVDTPGIQANPRKSFLSKAMEEQVWASVNEADVVCYLIDVTRGWTAADGVQLLKIHQMTKRPLLVLVSKADSVKKHVLAAQSKTIAAAMATMAEKSPGKACFLEAVPYEFSSKRPESLEALKSKLAALLPPGPWLFAEDAITDASEGFILSELIREQLFRKLADQIPFGCGVSIDKVSEGATLKIQATIVVDNPSHKKIVIGKGGDAIKVIGTLARHSIEQYFDGRKVFLELFVRVEKGWTEQQLLVEQLQK